MAPFAPNIEVEPVEEQSFATMEKALLDREFNLKGCRWGHNYLTIKIW